MTSHQSAIQRIARHDPRYPREAYEFIFDALAHTQKLYNKLGDDSFDMSQRHVSGPELLHGACDLAREEFGLLARVVFRHWGIARTDDIGEIVFNLIDAELLCRTEADHRGDFHQVFDIDRALTEGYKISLGETAAARPKKVKQ
jgi:uncharacterized repeat protein (TIGR04138 family)